MRTLLVEGKQTRIAVEARESESKIQKDKKKVVVN